MVKNEATAKQHPEANLLIFEIYLGFSSTSSSKNKPIQPSLSENVLTKLSEMGCLGWAWRLRRFYLAYSTHLI